MAVEGWRGTTERDVQTIVSAMQVQSSGWIPARYTGRLGRGTTEWEPLPIASGGVFAGVEDPHSWGARFSFKPGNGHGGAHCDVQIYDRGAHREVIIRPAYSMGAGARAKDIVNGMIGAINR